MILRSKHSMVLKIKTKDPTNKPKLIESLFLISLMSYDGDLKMALTLKRVESANLMR